MSQVGGGAAGSVVANRLSKYFNVLLFEAGGNPVPATAVPVFQINLALHPAINYKYTSSPQLNASLETDAIIRKMPGKMLGGSTSHHGLVYNRGPPLDYDAWANMTNDNSRKYSNILKYFKKSENFIGFGLFNHHGKGGLMTVDTSTIAILPTWFAAGRELGFYTVMHPNGPQIEGFTAVALTRERGQRVSAYTAFIKSIDGKRSKLNIERYFEASEILIDRNDRAYGVAYKRHGIPRIVHASKQIIISAGTFGSPLLLMKSGIGNAVILADAKILVKADLPVGKGVQDHVAVEVGPIIMNDTLLFPVLLVVLTEDSLREYSNREDGPLKLILSGPQAFIVSTRAKNEGDFSWPDVQIVKDGFLTNHSPRPHEIGFFIVLGRPKSKGHISLNTTAYQLGERKDENLAVIDYNILSDPSDVAVLVEGVKLALSIAESTTAFQRLRATYLDSSKHKNCDKFEFRSDGYWRCYAHQVGTTWLHFTSSCRMGSGIGDKNTVVDSKLNVLGISNLKVKDASVMSNVPNANTVAAVIMIAEKVSDGHQKPVIDDFHI